MTKSVVVSQRHGDHPIFQPWKVWVMIRKSKVLVLTCWLVGFIALPLWLIYCENNGQYEWLLYGL